VRRKSEKAESEVVVPGGGDDGASPPAPVAVAVANEAVRKDGRKAAALTAEGALGAPPHAAVSVAGATGTPAARGIAAAPITGDTMPRRVSRAVSADEPHDEAADDSADSADSMDEVADGGRIVVNTCSGGRSVSAGRATLSAMPTARAAGGALPYVAPSCCTPVSGGSAGGSDQSLPMLSHRSERTAARAAGVGGPATPNEPLRQLSSLPDDSMRARADAGRLLCAASSSASSESLPDGARAAERDEGNDGTADSCARRSPQLSSDGSGGVSSSSPPRPPSTGVACCPEPASLNERRRLEPPMA
jgi:hypothetical protein